VASGISGGFAPEPIGLLQQDPGFGAAAEEPRESVVPEGLDQAEECVA
jgi:hypothetical protein